MPMSPEDRRELELLKAEIGYDDRHPTLYWPTEPMSVDPAWDEIALFFVDHYPRIWKTAFFVYIADTWNCPLADVTEATSAKFEDIPDDVSDDPDQVPDNVCTRLSAPRPAFA